MYAHMTKVQDILHAFALRLYVNVRKCVKQCMTNINGGNTSNASLISNTQISAK